MAVVQTTGKFQFSSVSGNQTANMGANFTAGNGGVVEFVHYNGGTPGNRITAVTIGGTSATLAVRVVDAANQNTWECWYVPKSTGVAGGTTQVVLTLPAGAGQFISGSAEEWNDLDVLDTNGGDVTGSGSGSSSAPSATTSVSTSQTPVILYGGFVDTAGTNWTSATQPASWTESWEEPAGATHEAGAGGYFVDSGSTGTKTGTWATGASMTWSAAIVAFRVSSSAPAITAQPVGSAAAVGATTQYSITATGATSYQWQVSSNGGETWANVSGGSGATTTTYTTPAATPADNGLQYRCVATNSNGSTNSLGAWFHVIGIGLDGRGRGTSREPQHTAALRDEFRLVVPEHRQPPGAGDVKADSFAQAFRTLYFEAAQVSATPAVEVDLWTWSTRNRPGSGPLSTGAFYISQPVIWAPESGGSTVSQAGAAQTWGQAVAGNVVAVSGSSASFSQAAGTTAIAGAGSSQVTAQGSAAESISSSGSAQTYAQASAGQSKIAAGESQTYAQATGTDQTGSAVVQSGEASAASQAAAGVVIAGQGVSAAFSQVQAGSVVSAQASTAVYSQAAANFIAQVTAAAQSYVQASGSSPLDVIVPGVSASWAQVEGSAPSDLPQGSGGGAGGGMLHRLRLRQAFKDKEERDRELKKLPPIKEKERVQLKKSARKLIQREPVNFKELEARVSADLEEIGAKPAPNHLDWLLYFLRVEAHLIDEQRKAAEIRAMIEEDEELIVALLMEN